HLWKREIESKPVLYRGPGRDRGVCRDRLGSRDAHQNHDGASRHQTGDIVNDLRSLAKRWNNASLRHIATLPELSTSRRWPMFGMFAIGLVAGAVGSYAVTQRSEIKRLASRALMASDETPLELREVAVARPVSVTSHRSNHRRKASVE